MPATMRSLFTLIVTCILVTTTSSFAQIVTYSGFGGTSTSVTAVDPNITVTNLMDAGFGSNTACGSGGLSGKTVSTTWSSFSTSGPRYYIKITPNPGYQIDITGWNAGMRVSNTGPAKVRYAYSLDNGVTWTNDGFDHTLSNPGCGSSIASAWGGGTLPTGITSTTNGIIIALFPFAPGASTGTFQTNYINLYGTVTNGCTPPSVTATAAASAICIGTSTTLTAAGAGTGGTYSWAPNVGLSATTGATITANPATTTTYTVTGINAGGCSDTGLVTLTITPLPVVSVTGATTLCAGGATTTLTGSPAGGTWTSVYTSMATVTSSGMVTGVSAGTDTIKYAVSNSCGTTTIARPLTINPLPSAGTITGPDSVCVGASISLANATATSGGTWSSLSPAVATVSGSSVYGATAGTASIQYSVTTVCGTATTIHSVVVNPLPDAGTLSGADSVCYGTTISLTPSVSGGAWTSAGLSVATVTSSGIVSGVSPTLSTTTITYTVSTFSCGSASVTHPVTVKPQPNAGVVNGAVLCSLAGTTLTSSSPGGTWSSATATIATITPGGIVTGLLAGTTVITYSVTNSCGTATDTALVTVNPLPAPIVGNTIICVGVSTSLSSATPGGSWTTSNSSIATVDGSGNTTGTGIGTAYITYTNNSTGCYQQVPVTVDLSVTPTVTMAASSLEVCAGTSVTYSATSTWGGSSPIYVWSVNNEIIAGGTTYTYTPQDGDLVRVWFLSSLACAVPDTASTSVTMTVRHIASPSLDITTGMGDTVCVGVPATFTPIPVDGGTTPSFQWIVNGIPSGAGPTFTYIPANGDVVTANMTSNAYCRTADHAWATHILTVSPFLTPEVTTTINPGPVSCEGYPVNYVASQVNGGTSPQYQWLVNGNPAGAGPAYNYVPANGDVVQVILTSSFPCLTSPTDNENIAMTVIPVVQPVGNITAVPGYIVAPGAYDTFTVNIISGGGSAPTYQWFVNAVPVPGATTATYITNDLHTGDSINCVVTNNDQCSGVSAFNYIHITVANNVGINAIASNTDGVSIFPNPSTGSFHLHGSVGDCSKVNITITDMPGRVVHTDEAVIVNGMLDKQVATTGLVPGMYLVTIQSNTGSQTLRMMVK
jgi:hypothetical protein